MRVTDRLKEAGIVLPKPLSPPGIYLPYVRTGNLLFLNSMLAEADGKFITGRIGDTMTVADGYRAARAAGLKVLYQLNNACDGDLDRVAKIVKLAGFFNCVPDFTEHTSVMNGASELMVEAFGETVGRHCRGTCGCSSLPFGVVLKIEAIAEIR